MGKKSPTIAKLQVGQTVRVVLDLDLQMIIFRIGLTEIASTKIPQTFLEQELVPYL